MTIQDPTKRGVITERAIRLIVLLTCNNGRSVRELAKELNVCTKTVRRFLAAFDSVLPVITIQEQQWYRKGSTSARYKLDRTWMKQFVPEPVLDMWIDYEHRQSQNKKSNLGKGGC